MGRVLVVVYSLSGTGKRLARQLCDRQGWPMGEIAEARPRHGILGMWHCLLDSLLHRSPPIAYTGPPPIAFDTVVLISPIWIHRLAGPMRSFVTSRQQQLPEVAMVSVMGSAGTPAADAEVVGLLGRPLLLSTAFTQDEVLNNRYGDHLRTFASALQSAQEMQPQTRSPSWKPQIV